MYFVGEGNSRPPLMLKPSHPTICCESATLTHYKKIECIPLCPSNKNLTNFIKVEQNQRLQRKKCRVGTTSENMEFINLG